VCREWESEYRGSKAGTLTVVLVNMCRGRVLRSARTTAAPILTALSVWSRVPTVSRQGVKWRWTPDASIMMTRLRSSVERRREPVTPKTDRNDMGPLGKFGFKMARVWKAQ